MNWFFIALIAPFLWAITNHIDKHLVDRYAKNVKFTSFIISAAIFILVVALVILLFDPTVLRIPLTLTLLAILAGGLFTAFMLPYYSALKLEEASIVVPMFQMIPILGFVLGYFLLNEHLSLVQIVAGFIIISGSFGLSLELGQKIRIKSRVFLLMFVASVLVSLGVFFYKFVAIRVGYWPAIFWQETGLVLSAVMLLLKKDYRINFLQLFSLRNRKFIFLSGINETLALGGSLSINYVYLLAPIALVQLVASVQPLFVFMIGIVLSIFLPKFVFESISRKFLAQKIIFICLILVGSYLLFRIRS